ncbi:hypothetical protein JNUCC64_18440 [Streptomyces sp. JNUCC 64]
MFKRMLRSVLATFSVVVAAGALGLAGATTAQADTGWGWVAPAKGGSVISKPADTGWGFSVPANVGKTGVSKTSVTKTGVTKTGWGS